MNHINMNSIEAQLADINILISKLEDQIPDNQQLPETRVKIRMKKKSPQYYLRRSGEKKEKYVPKKDLETVRQILQQSYNRKLYQRLLDMKQELQRFKNKYSYEELLEVYDGMCVARRALIDPVIEPISVFVDKWYTEYRTDEKNGFEENLRFPTDRGELVRSKSEKILADLFAKNKIPYVYEPVVRLDKKRHVFPDFVLLNTRTRKTYLWEHLGLIDDGEYATKNFKKIAQYEKCGYFIGENLIITMESNDSPMDIKAIERKIRAYLY